ncbi:MAG: DUF4345 domain-containing protein [Proteobacteria bacterium]|nr:DUF4345 domain-containing protein [Pseudomonadota bacterium]
MLPALSVFTLLFGLVCLGISLVHIAFGPASIPGSVPVNATMDSEDRFYATLFTGFGLAMIWASRDLVGRRQVFLALMATFFLGGIARLVSAAAVGWPSPLFTFLGSLELVIPPVSWLVLRRALR